MIEQQIKMELLVSGLENKANNCIDIVLPTNDEDSLKNKLELVCDKDNSTCCIIKTKCNCKIKLDDKVDILELNQKLIKLNELCSADEVTAVSEYIGMKKSTIDNYYCKEQEGVTIDEIINKIKVNDYKFYTNKQYLDSTGKMAVYDNLFYDTENIPKIIKRLYDNIGIFNRFEIDEVLCLYSNDELVEIMAQNGFCIVASTGAIEEIEKDNKKE